MKNQKILDKIKKNSHLSKSEKKELIEFWANYTCPANIDQIIEASYPEGDTERFTIANRLDFFYDETPLFIQRFFMAMSKGEEFVTRFATYKVVTV